MDFNRCCSGDQNRKYPDLCKCEELWEQYNTPKHVIGHCRAVSATASAIGRKLNEHGYRLNIELIESAGWLHDIARTSDFHWQKGAEIASEMGYGDVADIILVHMKYQLNSRKQQIDELDLVCLADRLVKEDRYVGPDERMEYIINKAKDEPGAELRIRKSFEEIRILKKRIEAAIGMSLENLMCSE